MDNLGRVFTDLTSRGCDIEIVLVVSEIDIVRVDVIASYLGITQSGFRGRLGEAWDQMRRYQLAIPEQYRQRFVLRAHKEALYSSCFIIDYGSVSAKILVDIKIYRLGRESSFAIELVDPGIDDSLYDRFVRSFLVTAQVGRLLNPSGCLRSAGAAQRSRSGAYSSPACWRLREPSG
jgi:hypothetical protein